MRKSISPRTPARVYRYAVQVGQPHLKLRDATKVAAQTILTVLFAAAARISSLSDTCRLLRDVPDEHAVAEALYATLPEYNTLRRRVQAALHGQLPRALRRRPQVIALDLTLLPHYGADRKTNPHIVRSKAKKGTCSFHGYGTASGIRKGQRSTLALTALTRDRPWPTSSGSCSSRSAPPGSRSATGSWIASSTASRSSAISRRRGGRS